MSSAAVARKVVENVIFFGSQIFGECPGIFGGAFINLHLF